MLNISTDTYGRRSDSGYRSNNYIAWGAKQTRLGYGREHRTLTNMVIGSFMLRHPEARLHMYQDRFDIELPTCNVYFQRWYNYDSKAGRRNYWLDVVVNNCHHGSWKEQEETMNNVIDEIDSLVNRYNHF